MLVQTSPKVSYRVEHLLMYFDNLLPVGEQPDVSFCLCLDEFSAHLALEVWELVVEYMTHMLILTAGAPQA